MTADTVEGLLLGDDQGQYYLIPRTLLEQCRVPADRFALPDQEHDTDAVSGYGLISHKWLISSGGDRPTESLTFNLTSMQWGSFPLVGPQGSPE
jgi:hypothetical protein